MIFDTRPDAILRYAKELIDDPAADVDKAEAIFYYRFDKWFLPEKGQTMRWTRLWE